MTKTIANTDAEYFLDITNDVCPMTFVRTKLLIEKMRPGERAEVRLQGAEPLSNVPRSVREIGHTIVSLTPENPAGPADGPHRLVLKIADKNTA
ncbi:MAG: sulfurtransferase TusA family protein [Rhodospirillales bacterium]|nr:sulfurtransferase TusA family protein [Rhodospirillales bacterium]